MASRPTQVSVGGVVDPLQGARQGLTAAGDIYSKYLDQEARKKQLDAEQKRWDITNDRAQQKFDTEMGEIQRTQQQRDLLNQYTPEAAKMANARALAASGDLPSMIAATAQGFNLAKDRLLSSDSEAKALNDSIKSREALRASQGLTPEEDAGLRSDYEVLRNKVLGQAVPGSVNGTTIQQGMNNAFTGYDMSMEDKQNAIAAGLIDRGVDTKSAYETGKQLAAGTDTKKQMDANLAAMRKAAVDAQQQRFEDDIKLGTLQSKYDKSSGYTTNGGKNGKSAYIPYEDIEKSVTSIVDEGKGWLASAPGTLDDGQIAKVLQPLVAKKLSKGYSPNQVKQAIETTLIGSEDKGWWDSTAVTKDNLEKIFGAVTGEFKKPSGSPGGYNRMPSITTPGSVPAAASLDDARTTKVMSPLRAIIDAYSTKDDEPVVTKKTRLPGKKVDTKKTDMSNTKVLTAKDMLAQQDKEFNMMEAPAKVSKSSLQNRKEDLARLDTLEARYNLPVKEKNELDDLRIKLSKGKYEGLDPSHSAYQKSKQQQAVDRLGELGIDPREYSINPGISNMLGLDSKYEKYAELQRTNPGLAGYIKSALTDTVADTRAKQRLPILNQDTGREDLDKLSKQVAAKVSKTGGEDVVADNRMRLPPKANYEIGNVDTSKLDKIGPVRQLLKNIQVGLSESNPNAQNKQVQKLYSDIGTNVQAANKAANDALKSGNTTQIEDTIRALRYRHPELAYMLIDKISK